MTINMWSHVYIYKLMADKKVTGITGQSDQLVSVVSSAYNSFELTMSMRQNQIML